jgi:hypothetical protein
MSYNIKMDLKVLENDSEDIHSALNMAEEARAVNTVTELPVI